MLWINALIIGLSLCACTSAEVFPEPEKRKGIDGIRIGWDYSTLKRIAPQAGRTPGYYGYSRMIELHDGRLACVYETHPSANIEMTISTDKGNSWSNPQVLFSMYDNIGMFVPEIIELQDHSILIACNPRPKEPYTEDRKFGIRVRKSHDGGVSWGENQLVYEAWHLFKDGCWEPSFLQLPDGEVQLYFSNEGIYTQSDEQNISILRSVDLGESWSEEPEIVGYRQNRRDGMPVPLLLEDKGKILVVVEDNKSGEFKPSLYHEPLSDNWSKGFVDASDARRLYHPLIDPLPDAIYGGGPYLNRLKTGEVLLSYQTSLNRDLIWDRSSMAVEIGDDEGMLFGRRSVPFLIPLDKWGLWNSLAVINNGFTPVAITSTNAWSEHSTEVWMIKGRIIPEFVFPFASPVLDGALDEWCCNDEWPYFIGHMGPAQLRATVGTDGDYLYAAIMVNDKEMLTGETADSRDGFAIQVDARRSGYVIPHRGVFAIHVYTDGSIIAHEGINGKWESRKNVSEIKVLTTVTQDGYQSELAIPFSFLGISDNTQSDMGVNFVLKKKTSDGYYEESITSNHPGKPFTWSRLLPGAD